jgi:hypothetical protein
MKKILVVVVILGLVAVGFGQTLTVKGHQLGENTEEFLRSEPAIQAHMAQCRGLAIGYNAYMLNISGQLTYDPSLEKYMLKDKKGRAHWDIDALTHDYLEYSTQQCFLVMLEPIKSDGHRLQTFSGNSDVEWFFKDGIMWRMSITARATYEQVRDDFSKRIGVPPISEKLIPKHNAYGATWSDPDADWLTAEVHAHLSQKENPADPGNPWLEIETRAAFDEQVRKMKAQPNPLD